MPEPQTADWWYSPEVQKQVRDGMTPSLCRLFVELRKGNEHRSVLCSGFLGVYKDRYFWLTAGHVLEALKATIHEQGWKIGFARLLESGPAIPPFHTGVPVDIDPFDTEAFYSLDASDDPSLPEFGLDVCVMRLRPLVFRSLIANKRVRFLPLEDAASLDLETAAGLFVLGVPSETVSQQSRNHIQLMDCCIPASIMLTPPDDVKTPPGAIVAQLLALDGDNLIIDDIGGMSGGPVIAVERRGVDSYGFRLAGLQSSWLRGRRIVFISSLKAMLTMGVGADDEEADIKG